MKCEETEIILQLQQRFALYEDMKAYKQLYEMLYAPLYTFSFSFVKSKEVAEEIVSDVFIKLWAIRADLQSILNLKVYLYTITKNFSLNYITKHNKMRVVSLDDTDQTILFHYTTPEQSYISAELMSRINQSINQLPSQCRVIFFLVKEADLRYKDVAAILNISVNTVRNQVAIAVRKIAEELPPSLKRQLVSTSRFSES